MTETFDNTHSQDGAAPADPDDAAAGVRGGSADRMDSPGEGSGGLAGAGADGQTDDPQTSSRRDWKAT